MRDIPSYRKLSDQALAVELSRLVGDERRAMAKLIACLEEFDRRRLYLAAGFTSLYAYCGVKLRLSEDAAYKRIEVARATRRCPTMLDMLLDGRLSLTTACLVAKQLSSGSVDLLLERAAFKTRREVETLIAALHPQPPVPSVVRKLPEPKALASSAVRVEESGGPAISLAELVGPSRPEIPSRRPVVAPLSESHYKLQVTVSSAAHERLRAIQDLMRHQLPSGDPAAIVERALEVLHVELLKQKAASVAKPRLGKAAADARGRYIPAAVTRAVFGRDEGKCAFVSVDGTRCGSASGVEFHHVVPYAVGGEASVDNIELRCRAHNGFEWTRHLDEETMTLAAR